jgi:hypothetical protein
MIQNVAGQGADLPKHVVLKLITSGPSGRVRLLSAILDDNGLAGLSEDGSA